MSTGTRHTISAFDDDMDEIRGLIAEMGARAETAVVAAMTEKKICWVWRVLMTISNSSLVIRSHLLKVLVLFACFFPARCRSRWGELLSQKSQS